MTLLRHIKLKKEATSGAYPGIFEDRGDFCKLGHKFAE